MRVGDVECFVLSDGEFRMDGGGIFGLVPKALWEMVLPADELNRVSMALNCLFIISSGRRILVDTGFGRKLSPKDSNLFALRRDHGDLLDNLEHLGCGPGDIDIVINTHLHSDHCGGNTISREGVPVPTFPNARYWIQRLEWADACYPNERTRSSYIPEHFLPIQQAGQLQLLHGDARVTKEVRCVVTRGHTRAHQSVIVESAGEVAVFLGDLASGAVQLERLPWTTAFDTEPLETVETKRAMRDWAAERHALLIFGHDVSTPCGYLQQKGDNFWVEAP
jgi:glyoxylase-like metal-dependent hydrolase (beta-lactamase superfamily II)